jgi:hypothetical protein
MRNVLMYNALKTYEMLYSKDFILNRNIKN